MVVVIVVNKEVSPDPITVRRDFLVHYDDDYPIAVWMAANIAEYHMLSQDIIGDSDILRGMFTEQEEDDRVHDNGPDISEL